VAAFARDASVLPTNLLVRSVGNTSPTLAYAVERMVAELRTVHARQVAGELAAADPFKAARRDTGVVILGRPDESAQMKRWCRQQKVNLSALTGQPDGYRVAVQADPLRVVIAANSDLGAWYGACAWLDSLRDAPDGTVSTPLGEFGGAPALAIRFTRGLIPGKQPTRLAEALPHLDWWARWRMNVTSAGSGSDSFLQEYLPEAHKRGIRVVRGLGVRNLCAADDEAVARCAEEFRKFLLLGGDGVSALWDDLAHERCYGHCDRCRARFGTNSLPHEIVRVLEALCDVAAQAPRRPLLLWCPSHYSENRYPEMSDEAFFRVIGTSRRVREQTQMYFCEFAPERTALLDQLGLTNRVWWYNGMRTVYHVCRNWPTHPGTKLAIPDLKSFNAPDFARFEVGWKTGISVQADGAVLPVPDTTWQSLRTLPARFQGYYPCMDLHPYHAAVSGLFAFDPCAFEQAQADRVVFRSLFGPGSARPARAWSDAYVQFQLRLAQTADGQTTDAQQTEFQERLARWRSCSREVQACAVSGRSMVSPDILKSALGRMQDAEQGLENILNQRDPSGRR
jgi:hypothetical protein